MSLALSRKHCLLFQALTTDLFKMFPCVNLAFSHILSLLEEGQHTTVLRLTGYGDHGPMPASWKRRVLVKTCRHKEQGTGHQGRAVRSGSYLRGTEWSANVWLPIHVCRISKFLEGFYLLASKRKKKKSSMSWICYDSVSERKEIQGWRSPPPHCLSQWVTFLNFTRLCHIVTKYWRLDP